MEHLDQVLTPNDETKFSGALEELQQFAVKWLDETLPQLEKNNPDSACDLMEGYAMGRKSFLRPEQNNPMARHTTATEYLCMMLVMGKELERLDSVAEMYGFLHQGMGKNFRISPESFRDLCNRIGLQGRLYRRKKRDQLSKRRKPY